MDVDVNSIRWLTLDNLDGEQWKEIPGYEGFYDASSYGRIRSKERFVDNYFCRQRILKQSIKRGRWYVLLSKKGKRRTVSVHRLVALSFLPNPNSLPEVNHIDENPLNNRLDNLEWCSQSYNLSYGTRIERGLETRRRRKTDLTEKKYLTNKHQIDREFPPDVENLKDEEWRPIPGYEGMYEISNYGRLKSLLHGIPFLVRVKTTRSGRMNANLHYKGKCVTFGVHVLVAKAFIPNPENLPEVNHKDENPLNNCVENLEWCTHNYNMHYGTLYQRLSEKQKNCSSTSMPVSQYDLKGNIVKLWPSIREVQRTLKTKGWKTICSACKGKTHSAIGYQWRYIEKGTVPPDKINPCRRRCSTAPKLVYQYTLDRKLVNSYKSVTAAGVSVGIPGTNISACIKGKQKTAGGFLWFDKIQ